MSAGAPWSVKGIDPKAREVAKDLARRSGMTLGEWLNRVILEDDLPEDLTVETQFADRLHRIAQASPKLAVVPTSPDLERIAFALDRVTDRIEASETRTGLAINGVEHSVRQALARIETSEREHHATANRLESMLAESAAEQGYFGERLRRLEGEGVGPRSAEVLRALETRLGRAEPEAVMETVLQRLGERLASAESRTATSLQELKASLRALDGRLGSVERGAGDGASPRFEALGQALTDRVEAVRAEVIQKLEAAAGPAFEARLAAMAHTVRDAERRATQVVEEIGRQVLSMAEAVGRKLSDVDQRSADAIDQVGTEVARIAGAVELRLARSEQAQALAFERLGAELSQVTATLGDRLAVSERQSAETPSDVEADADVTRFSEAMAVGAPLSPESEPDPEPQSVSAPEFEPEPGHLSEPQTETDTGPASGDQPDRETWATAVIPPDLQTAALLEEARQRLGPPPEPEPEPAFQTDTGPYGSELFSRAEVDAEAASETFNAPWRRLDLDVPAGDLSEVFAPIREPADEDLFAPAETASTGPQLSTREVIDRARAAARAADASKPLEMRARVEGRAASGRLFQGFGARPQPRRRSSTLQTALMVAGGAAFLSVGAAGLTLMQGPAIEARQAELSPLGANPRAAVALSSGALAPAGAGQPLTAPVYVQVRADVEAGLPGAVARLRALADADHPQAQLYLAQLYDLGEAGLTRDPVEARRLVGLAAENGDVQAMHNLAVFYFHGEGGAQDLASAAQWFRKAAGAGVLESQYNLGLLYQSGSGVRRDLAQARYWFGLAAAQGDAEARRALAELTPATVGPASAEATSARKLTPSAPTVTASQNVRQTQLILARLGYYKGPADGVSNPDYRTALVAYQRDQTHPHPAPRPDVAAR